MSINNEPRLFEHIPDVIDVRTLAEILGIGFNSAYTLVLQKKIKSVRIGRIHRIPKTAVIAFLNGKEKSSDGEE